MNAILTAIIIVLVLFIGYLLVNMKQNSEYINRNKDFFKRHGIDDKDY